MEREPGNKVDQIYGLDILTIFKINYFSVDWLCGIPVNNFVSAKSNLFTYTRYSGKT